MDFTLAENIMELTIYLDGENTRGIENPVFSYDLPTESNQTPIIERKELSVPEFPTLSVGVSKAQGPRYNVAVFDGEIPIIMTNSKVEGFSNTRVRLKEGVFLNIHIEETKCQPGTSHNSGSCAASA